MTKIKTNLPSINYPSYSEMLANLAKEYENNLKQARSLEPLYNAVTAVLARNKLIYDHKVISRSSYIHIKVTIPENVSTEEFIPLLQDLHSMFKKDFNYRDHYPFTYIDNYSIGVDFNWGHLYSSSSISPLSVLFSIRFPETGCVDYVNEKRKQTITSTVNHITRKANSASYFHDADAMTVDMPF
jgi:hypothetical protein